MSSSIRKSVIKAMKKVILSLSFLIPLTLWSQDFTPKDSLKYDLEEIIVNAPSVIRKVDKNIYQVSEEIKERSSSAVNLINNLKIPNISVNEVMEKITSSLGTIEIRVNGRTVDISRLKSINVDDIQRIEWIDNPGLRYGTDLGGVVNIIVRNPTTGGSFNIYVSEGLTLLFNNSQTNLTLNQGKSQWQIGGGTNLRGGIELYREYFDSYKLPDGSVLQRTQTPLGGRFDNSSIWPYISYNYMNSDTTNLYVGFNYYGGWNQKMRFEGLIDSDFSRASELIKLTETEKWPRRSSPSINLYFEQKLRKNQTLVFSGSLSYNESKTGRDYSEYDMTNEASIIDIENNIKSQTVGYYIEGNYIKTWEKAGKVTAGFSYNGSNSRSVYIDYDDQEIRQILDKLYFFGEYMMPIKKVTLTVGVGGTLNKNRIKGGKSENSFNFTPRFSANWRLNDFSRWNVTYSNSVVTPSSTQLSPITQEIDGIQIEHGNPDLKSYLSHRLRFSYNYSNNSNLYISPNVFYTHISNPIMKYYSWENDKILRSYSNEGLHNMLGVNLSISYQPIPDWVSLSADVTYYHYHNHGKGFAHTLDSWEESFSFQLYHWNWTLGFDFMNPGATLWGETISRGERFNTLSLSYRWKDWNFTAAMFMPFGRYSQSEKIIAELVNQSTTLRTHIRMPMIEISYNINWGHQKDASRRKLSGRIENNDGAAAAGR